MNIPLKSGEPQLCNEVGEISSMWLCVIPSSRSSFSVSAESKFSVLFVFWQSPATDAS